jgi:hypothetical protein
MRRYLLFLMALPLCAAPTVTVSASAQTLLGTNQSISLTVDLVDPNNTGLLRVNNTQIIPIMTASTVTPGTTATVGPIYGNDVIKDGFGNLNSTYYRVRVFTVINSIVSSTAAFQQFFAFTGAGTVDLATATPLAPSFMTGTNGSVVTQGPLTVKSINTIRFADQYAGADCGAKINAAVADGGTNTVVIVNTNCGSTVSTPLVLSVGTQLEFLAGAWTWTPGIQTISTPNVVIEGVSSVSTQFNLGAATGDLFAVTANSFQMNNLYITAAVGIPRTSGCVLNIQGGGAGIVHDVLLQDVYCGFKASVVNSNLWRFTRIGAQTAGGNWNSLFVIGPIASGTITSWQLTDIQAGLKTSTTSAPTILLDSGTDGFELHGFVGGAGYLNVMPNNTQPTLQIQSTGASNAPQWVRISNMMAESGFSAEDCVITAGRDISIVNSYFASSLRGCDISGGTGIHFLRSVFVNHQQQGVLIQGGSDVSFVDNDFSDNSVAANGGTSHIFVGANVSDFRLSLNRFGNHLLGNTNKANFGITVNAGTSNNYQISLNRADLTQLTGAALLSDGGTGGDKFNFNQGGAPSVALVPCTTSQKTETAADTNVLTCAIPTQAGSYRIRFMLNTSATNAATLGWTATWTDAFGNAHTPTNLAMLLEGTSTLVLTNTSTAGAQTFWGYADVDVNNAGTSIVVKLTFSGTSFTAKVSATVERII